MEENQRFEELQLSVPWGHIYAKAWGSLSDNKILAVHGLMDNAGSFDRIIKLLPKDYYIVSIDLPGHGFSSHFTQGVPLNFFSYVLTIYHVLNALHWDTCIYMGHSFGGHIGTMFSILYPQKFKKLILLDSLLSTPIDNQDLIPYLQDICNITIKANTDITPRLYTKEEVLYALKYKRFATLNSEAAEALFKRAVTEVNNLYKFNRDFRLIGRVLTLFNIEQTMQCLSLLSVPCLIIIPSSSIAFYNKYSVQNIANMLLKNDLITFVNVTGNHDVHNNCPEQVAPSLCKFLRNNVISKL